MFYEVLFNIIVGVAIGLFVNFLALGGIRLIVTKGRQKEETADSKISELNKIEDSLKSLIKYIDNQRRVISETEAKLQQLHEERSQLEPLVKNNRELVEAILEPYIQKVVPNVWRERTIGVFIGIAGSLIANIIWFNFVG